MSGSDNRPVWAAGDKYEPYIGRWSRLVAARFLDWLDVADSKRWVDVGCGTGALLQTILATRKPTLVSGVDRSENFLRHAGQGSGGERPLLAVSDGQSLPFVSAVFDLAVSGLVLNHVPQPENMVREMSRVTRSGGVCALYVWDYASKMELLRYFWDSASDLDPEAAKLDEAFFPVCQPGPLKALFEGCGLVDVEVRRLTFPRFSRTSTITGTHSLAGKVLPPLMSCRCERKIELLCAKRSASDCPPSKMDQSNCLLGPGASKAGEPDYAQDRTGSPNAGLSRCTIVTRPTIVQNVMAESIVK